MFHAQAAKLQITNYEFAHNDFDEMLLRKATNYD